MLIKSSMEVSTNLTIVIIIGNHYQIVNIDLMALILLDSEPMGSLHLSFLISANYSLYAPVFTDDSLRLSPYWI